MKQWLFNIVFTIVYKLAKMVGMIPETRSFVVTIKKQQDGNCYIMTPVHPGKTSYNYGNGCMPVGAEFKHTIEVVMEQGSPYNLGFKEELK